MNSGPARGEPVTDRADGQRTALIEPVRWWDIEALVELERLLFPGDSPWTAAMFWAELAAGHHYILVRRDERVVAYAGLAGATATSAGAPGDDQDAEVQTIGVHPKEQGRGLGRMVLRDLLRVAGDRRVLLDVRTDNAPALALYESEGFRRIGLRRRYYQPSGADAWTMERPR